MQSQAPSSSSAGSTNQSAGVSGAFNARQIDPDNLEDLLLCLSYLKQRELFLYKMAEDPAHKAMLYFLELMMNSESPLPVAYLASKLNSRQFTPEMARAVGEHEEGLRRFLTRYPSLFTVSGNLVSLNDITSVSNTMMLTPTPTPTSAPPPPATATTSASASASTSASSYSPNAPQSSNASSTLRTTSASLTQSQQPQQQPGATKLMLNGSANGSEEAATVKIDSLPAASAASSSSATNTNCTSSAVGSTRLLSTLGSHSFSCSSTVANVLASIQSRSGAPLLGNQFQSATNTNNTVLLAPTPNGTQNQSQNVAADQTASPNGARLTGSTRKFDEDAFLLESEAVRYFTEKLLRRNDRWVPIKSLAGHLSQASADIRQVVGPQSRFRKFLLSQPRVFEVQAERDLVALREEIRREYLAAFPELDRDAAACLTTGDVPLLRSGRPQAAGRPKSLNLGADRGSATAKLLAYSRSRKVSNARLDAETLSDADTASLISALGASADCGDWGAQDSVPDTPLEHLLLESHSTVSSPPPTTTPNNAVAALRDALANAVRDGSAAMRATRRSANGQARNAASLAAQSSSSNRVDSSSSSSASSEGANGPRRAKRSLGSATGNSQAVTMTADEYAAVEFVRKFVERATKRRAEDRIGNDVGVGAPIQQLVAALGEDDNESVRKAIGWTLTELEAFLKKHLAFFELVYNPDPAPSSASNSNSTTAASDSTPSNNTTCRLAAVANRKLSRNAHIIIAGTATARDDPCVSGRTMTNRCGRIFHVLKLWGIIDLGRHEHVFFDKSLFKHVDDLSKYFHVGQTVWFNAILAPKDSRAKWRATQVWNAADKLLIDRAAGSGASCATNANASPNATAGLPQKSELEGDCELLTGQPKVRMQLVDDVRFLTDADNDEEDLIKLLDSEPAQRPDGEAKPKTSCSLVTLADVKTLELRSGALPEDNLLYATNREDVRMSEYVVPMPQPLPGDDAEPVAVETPSRRTGDRSRLVDAICQTLSTGDILATQLYHEDSS